MKFSSFAGCQPPAPPALQRGGLFALAIALLFGAFQVQAADWHYRMRPGDNPWNISGKYLRQGVQFERLLRHNRIQNPHALPPGTVISIPVAWLRHQPGHAEVIANQGQTEVLIDGQKQNARKGLKLPAGTVLHSGSDASLTLGFADGSQMQMHADSELWLDKLDSYGDTGIFNIHLRLPRGRISSLVRPRTQSASRYVVETPGMMSSVRGTHFRSAADARQSRTEVLQGKVAAAGARQQVMVDAGRGSVSDGAGQPSQPIALLPAPELSGIPARILRLPAALSWQAVPGAVRYRLQASQDENFSTLLLDTDIERASASLDVHHEGALYLRVRAVADNGLEGMDAVARSEIAAQPSPPFVIAPVEGSEVAGPRPRLRWTAAQQQGLSYRVEIAQANDDFRTPLINAAGLHTTTLSPDQDLPPGQYQWRIGAADAAGKLGAWSEAIPFTVLPAGQAPSASSDENGLKVRWDKAGQGQRFRFQLARDASFSRPHIDRMLDENSIELPEIRSGTWYLRVMLVEPDGFEHPPGPTQTVKLGCLPCRVLLGTSGALLLILL